MLTSAKHSQSDLKKNHETFCGLYVLVLLLLKDYPGSRLCGHRDLSPDLNHNGEIEPEEWVKQCPCFDAATILTEPPPPNPACL